MYKIQFGIEITSPNRAFRKENKKEKFFHSCSIHLTSKKDITSTINYLQSFGNSLFGGNPNIKHHISVASARRDARQIDWTSGEALPTAYLRLINSIAKTEKVNVFEGIYLFKQLNPTIQKPLVQWVLDLDKTLNKVNKTSVIGKILKENARAWKASFYNYGALPYLINK